jgi:hypothetical protein
LTYFNELTNTLANVPPENIMNYDETNFTHDPGKKRVLVKRGAKHAYGVLETSKSSIFCEENEISFMLLPPNSTHLCQPLDVAVFRAIKAQWRKVLMQWKEKNVGCVPKTEFPRLLRETIQSVKSSENVIAGFKVCGIIPLNSRKVLDKLIPEGPPTVADEALQGSFAEIMGTVIHLNQVKRVNRKWIN